MQTTDIEIAGNVLKALSIFAAAKKDPRSFLQGVYVHKKGTKTVGVSTDGKILGLSLSITSNLSKDDGVFIPVEMIKSLLKSGKGKWLEGSVFIRTDGDLTPGCEYRMTLSLGGHSVSSYVRGVDYVQYQKIIPKSLTKVYGSYDPDLLIRVRDAFTLATDLTELPLIGNGVNGAAVAYDEGAKWLSLIMPLSKKLGDEQPDTLPDIFNL